MKRKCLKCETEFRSTGVEWRLCHNCRKAISKAESYDEDDYRKSIEPEGTRRVSSRQEAE